MAAPSPGGLVRWGRPCGVCALGLWEQEKLQPGVQLHSRWALPGRSSWVPTGRVALFPHCLHFAVPRLPVKEPSGYLFYLITSLTVFYVMANKLHVLPLLIFTITLSIGTITIPIVKLKKLRHLEVKQLDPGHTASKLVICL